MANESIFDRYSSRAKCAISIISAFSIIERCLLAKHRHLGCTRTFLDWEQVCAFGRHTNIKNKSGNAIEVYRYLLRPDPWPGQKSVTRVLLKRGDPGPLEPLSNLVGRICEQYFHDDKIFSVAFGQQLEPPEMFEFLRNVVKPKWYKDTIKRLEVSGSEPQHSDVLRAFKTISDSLVHPDFPSVSAIGDLTVACEFHGLAPKKKQRRDRSGLFAVIREARGWTVEKDYERDTNLIVRDVLWIENLDQIFVDGVKTVGGAYYSVYDSAHFVVHAAGDVEPSRRTHNVYVHASRSNADKHEHTFRLIFPMEKRSPISILRDGIIAGTARNTEQLAAWKVLLIEPNWDSAWRLETLLHLVQARDQMHQMKDILEQGNYCGVLYRQSDEAEKKLTGKRRESFRRLALGSSVDFTIDRAFGGGLKNEILEKIHEAVDDAIRDDRVTSLSVDREQVTTEYSEKLLSEFDKILQRRWHLIDPMQIITFISKNEETSVSQSEIDGHVSNLLERADLAPY